MLTRILHCAVSNPRIYDWVQALAGVQRVHDKLMPLLANTDHQVVLDVGGGTGGVIPLLPSNACYICLDIDPGKLVGLRCRHSRAHAILGSVTILPLADRSADIVVCKFVAHHLPPQALALALQECARVCRDRLVFLDAIRVPGRFLSSVLWRYDQGRFPYTAEELQQALAPQFELEQVKRFAVYHQYLLCSARPKGIR